MSLSRSVSIRLQHHPSAAVGSSLSLRPTLPSLKETCTKSSSDGVPICHQITRFEMSPKLRKGKVTVKDSG